MSLAINFTYAGATISLIFGRHRPLLAVVFKILWSCLLNLLSLLAILIKHVRDLHIRGRLWVYHICRIDHG